jgi:zinc protease
MNKSLVLTALCAALAGCAQGADSPSGSPQGALRTLTLRNGLRVLLRPVPGSTQAAVVLLYSVGARNDPPGKSGLAHLTEHVYVTAAAGHTGPRKAEELKGNAQTGEEYTVLADLCAATEVEPRLREAADRMGVLRVEASDLEREKPRLLAEVGNMFGGMPRLCAWNRARERLRPTPHGGRRGGLPEEVNRITLADVRQHWQRYYKPANALLVLTGALPADAAGIVEREFGALPAGETLPAAPTARPGRPDGLKRYPVQPTLPRAGSEACLMFAAPPPGTASYAPFLVLARRLQARGAQLAGEGREAAVRFPPPAYYAVLDDPAVISASASLAPGETPEAAIQRLTAWVDEVVREPFRREELDALKAELGPLLGLTEVPDSLWAQNPYLLAFSLGRREQLRLDPRKLRAELEAVTPAQVRQCARTVFAPPHRAAVVVTVR